LDRFPPRARRYRNFWFLFAAILLIWIVPTAIQAFDTLFDLSTLSDSTWRLLYCLYGAPILMMLFSRIPLGAPE
jgi:hypothetical protein